MDREEAKKQISETCGIGWLDLVDVIYDYAPESIEITEVFQKYAWLEVRYIGEDTNFSILVEEIKEVSQNICEICGKSGAKTIIDGWDKTLCQAHYDSNEARSKYSCGNYD